MHNTSLVLTHTWTSGSKCGEAYLFRLEQSAAAQSSESLIFSACPPTLGPLPAPADLQARARGGQLDIILHSARKSPAIVRNERERVVAGAPFPLRGRRGQQRALLGAAGGRGLPALMHMTP